MTKGKLSLFLCALVIATGFGGTSPKAASDDDCTGTPLEAVTTIPSPLRKWAHIDCTPFGHVLASRDGWMWAWLDDSGTVFVPSQMVQKDPARLGNESYFTAIKVSELDAVESDDALQYFHDALEGAEALPLGYRVALTSVSGMSMTAMRLMPGRSSARSMANRLAAASASSPPGLRLSVTLAPAGTGAGKRILFQP